MTTKGNLELRLEGETLYASVESDGYEVFNAIVQLALFYNRCFEASQESIKREDFKEWFKGVPRRVFKDSKSPSDKLTGGVPCEVIIDPERKILLHNGHEDNYRTISDTFPYTVAGALNKLVNDYNYQVLEFESLAVREMKAREKSKDK